MKKYDVIIIGAGASGLMVGANASKRGRKTAILEMGSQPARKVALSGGGRCNITNMAVGVDRYFGNNPQFVRGALSRVRPTDVLQWMKQHNLGAVEKAPGQYFCADGADAVVNALVQDAQGADIFYNTDIKSVQKTDGLFIVQTNKDVFTSQSLVVASGGISFPVAGVSDIGYKIAKQFGHRVEPIRPALCAMKLDCFGSELAGVSIDVEVKVGKQVISDTLLFTHFGIGGPAIYRASVRDFSDGITINFCPKIDLAVEIRKAKHINGKKSMSGWLSQYIPARVAKFFTGKNDKNIADWNNKEIDFLVKQLSQFAIGADKIKLHNLQSAEIVRGGVDVADISSKTMESKLCPGLFWVGEVMDISGDLGGFNLHWAWASGVVAGQNA